MFNKYKNISNETFKMEFEILYADTRNKVRIIFFLLKKKNFYTYVYTYVYY